MCDERSVWRACRPSAGRDALSGTLSTTYPDKPTHSVSVVGRGREGIGGRDVERKIHAPDTGEIRIAKQYGLAYLPLIVMESEKLYEKHAAELGISTRPVYTTLGNNTAVNEALLSGSVDVVTNGPPGFLIFWSRTNDR